MTDTLEALAGTLSDGQVAERLGIAPDDVKAWRHAHDVAEFRQPPPTSTAPEGPAETARAALPRRSIVRRRADDAVQAVSYRALPAARAPEPEPDLRPDEGRSRRVSSALEALHDRLGQVPDAVLAEEAGVSRASVGAYRRSLGISAYADFLFKPGHRPRRAAGSGEPKTPALKKRPGRKSALDAFADRIGVAPDATIAALAGVTKAAVATWRHRHGLSATRARRAASEPRGVGASLDAFVAQLGTISDGEIARRAGVSRSKVAAYREQHQIPAWQGFRTAPRRRSGSVRTAVLVRPLEELPKRKEATPGVVARERSAVDPRASPVLVRLRAYTILASSSAGQRTFIAVGEDMATACRRAERGLANRSDGPWWVDTVHGLDEVVLE